MSSVHPPLRIGLFSVLNGRAATRSLPERSAATDVRRVGPRMQDIDGPAHIQTLSAPPRTRRSRVDVESVPDVRGAKGLKRIGGHHRRRRDVGQHSPVRPPELQRAVALSGDLIALFVHGAVMPTTQEREIRERRRAAGRPMTDVMALAEP